ncbi:MAG: high-potential iron-sulfur protein [Halobacteriales archaeon]
MGGEHQRSNRGNRYDPLNRRRYLVATAGIAALSGCLGDSGGTPTATETSTDGELPAGVSRDEFENGPVPQAYRTATSLGDEQRDPEDVTAKSAVSFSEYEEAVENGAHEPGTCCANCADYIIDRNGDAFGACAEVQGYIDGEDWCTVYEELPEPEVPKGMEEDELATAEVPEAYRAASSQGGEERNPDDLMTQAEVSLQESVEAIADGPASPGQSCGNCAEFIPDGNGDTWGACAKVEGYVAVEDWCTVWEHVSAEL